ncbi:MAG: glycosyl hydrolase family 8 [Methylococcaceae bacterium]
MFPITNHFISFSTEILLVAVLLIISGCAHVDISTVNCTEHPRRPFPQHTKYTEKSISPTVFNQTHQDQHVKDFYNDWKKHYLISAGENKAGQLMFRIAFGKHSDITVSEGQGYGMIITALMAGYDPQAQTYFDGLWRFSREYPSSHNENLMSWKIQNNKVVDGNGSAFDGDADISYALLLAEAQWGNQGKINYHEAALDVINAVYDSTIGPKSGLPMLGDWVTKDGKTFSQFTPRSSDFMPAHFRAFAHASNNKQWQEVIANSQNVIDFMQSRYSPKTGLLPDFISSCLKVEDCKPAEEDFLEGPHDGDYHYNSGRVPLRLGIDALLYSNQQSKAQVQKIIRWLVSSSKGKSSRIKAGYKLDGQPYGHYFTSFFVAPFGVAAMLAPEHQGFLNSIYQRVYKLHEDYYEDSINLLSLFVMTRNYWTPESKQRIAVECD